MVYNSIYQIPSRLFFQILETGDYTLLDDESNGFSIKLENLLKGRGNEAEIEKLTTRIKKLETIWIELEEAHQKQSKNPKTEK